MSNPLAVVTGAASGIGLALTHELVARSIDVIAIDKDPFPHEGMTNVTQVRLDVSDRTAMQVLADELRPQRLRYVFANAGIGAPGSLHGASSVDWQRVFSINTLSPLHTLQIFWPYLASARGKAVVTVSAAAVITHPGAALYRASKAALLSILESLYYETKDSGVSVHALCPGLVQSGIVANALKENPTAATDGFTQYLLQAMAAAEPAGHFAARVLDELEGNAPFYWLTHADMRAAVEARHHALLHGQHPPFLMEASQ